MSRRAQILRMTQCVILASLLTAACGPSSAAQRDGADTADGAYVEPLLGLEAGATLDAAADRARATGAAVVRRAEGGPNGRSVIVAEGGGKALPLALSQLTFAGGRLARVTVRTTPRDIGPDRLIALFGPPTARTDDEMAWADRAAQVGVSARRRAHVAGWEIEETFYATLVAVGEVTPEYVDRQLAGPPDGSGGAP